MRPHLLEEGLVAPLPSLQLFLLKKSPYSYSQLEVLGKKWEFSKLPEHRITLENLKLLFSGDAKKTGNSSWISYWDFFSFLPATFYTWGIFWEVSWQKKKDMEWCPTLKPTIFIWKPTLSFEHDNEHTVLGENMKSTASYLRLSVSNIGVTLDQRAILLSYWWLDLLFLTYDKYSWHMSRLVAWLAVAYESWTSWIVSWT